ncbi:MAG: amidase [Myxococcales bacterium]|nr:amidase [Myxococcales bacterium]
MSEHISPPVSKNPPLVGGLLRLVAGLMETSWPGNFLAKRTLGDLGVPFLRAAPCDEPLPAVHPLLADTGLQRVGAQGAPAVPEGDFARLPVPTAADYVAAYAGGRTTPNDVAAQVFQAVQRLDAGPTPLRAIIAQNMTDLGAQAEASTARWKAGQPLGPLDGVPVAVKDELDQAGYPTTVGTQFMGQKAARADATVVARLRAAGALLIGKANMQEIGLGVFGLNPHHGPARNPWDLTRMTGGSSSGPAAAVAAGLCPIAVGADGGGSIRIPAALCGLVGLKATYGRVSEHGAAPLCWSVGHVGPLAASARDAALAYALMAGPDDHDGNTRWQPPVDLDRLGDAALDGLRVGVFRPWVEDADAVMVNGFDRALAALQGRGAKVVEVELPDLELCRVAHSVTITGEMVQSQTPFFAKHRKDYAAATRIFLALAERVTPSDYLKAQRLRVRIYAHFMRALAACDVIATPSTGCTAPLIPAGAAESGLSDLNLTLKIMGHSHPANLTGLPAISVPAGYDPRGLPIGVQFIGRPWAESTLLRLAATLEPLLERRRPPVFAALLGNI